jgi:adenylate cyclase
MVPQGDFLVDVWQQRANLIVVMAGALAVAVGMVTILSRKYSRPLQALVAQSERIQNLNLERQAHAPSRLVEVESLAQAQERMCCALESFARYVPIGVVRELLRRGAAARLGGQTEVLTVMFSDMEGFTALAEAMSPEVLTNYLAEYFETVERVLDRHQATIDKFIGDSILAFWGAPVPNPDHARAAVLALLEAEDALDDFFVRASARGKPRLRTRFGLATGPVVVGNIGAPDRLNYSVIGNTVNLASRLEGLNRFYGTAVLASGSLVHVAGEGLVWRRVDRVVVKGQTQPVDIFEPLGQTGQVPAQTQEKKSVYESALDLLQIRQFQEALRLLHGPGRPFEKDLSFQRLAERCEHLLHEPPPPDWDTSFRFRDK